MSDESDTTSRVSAHRGFFPIVIGDEVSVAQAGGRLFVSRGNLALTQGGAQRMLVRGDVSIRQGGVQMLMAGGDVSISEGGACVAVGSTVRAQGSYIGFAVGKDVSISDDSRVIFGTREAAVFGAIAGVVCGLVVSLLRR